MHEAKINENYCSAINCHLQLPDASCEVSSDQPQMIKQCLKANIKCSRKDSNRWSDRLIAEDGLVQMENSRSVQENHQSSSLSTNPQRCFLIPFMNPIVIQIFINTILPVQFCLWCLQWNPKRSNIWCPSFLIFRCSGTISHSVVVRWDARCR